VEYITRSGYAADDDEADPAAGHLAKNVLPPEEIMKIRLLLALVGSAIGFVAPTLAQQKTRSLKNSTRHGTITMPPPWPPSSRWTRFL
jgi:hypothetical protein